VQDKKLLLCSFLDIKEEDDYKEKINDFIDKLNQEYSIPKEKIFIIKNLTNKQQYLITYIFEYDVNNKINFNSIYPGTIPIQKDKQNNVIFTINSLNKLIEKESGLNEGNIDYKSVSIDWSKYRNMCIILKNGELIKNSTKRIFIKNNL